MKKLLLILAIGASVVMADVSTNQDDLLSVATAGKTTGIQFEMSKEDMKDADGGKYISPYSTNDKSASKYNAYNTYLRTRIYINSMVLKYL